MQDNANSEFGIYGFLGNHVFLPTEEAQINICLMVNQDTTFKKYLSLFGWKVNILYKEHIVQCGVHRQAEVLYRFDLYNWNDLRL